MLMSQMICCSKTIMMQKQILTLFHLYPSVVVCLLLTHLPAANYRVGQKSGGAFNEERMTLWSNCIQMKWWSYSWLIFQPAAARSTGTEGGGPFSIERFLAASLLISKCCGVWCGMVWCVVWCVVMILLLTHPTAAALAQRVVELFPLLSVFLQRCC